MINKLQKTIFVIFIIFLSYSFLQNASTYISRLNLLKEYKAEHKKLAEENKRLKSEYKKADDPYYTEKNVRERLNLLKQNEESIIIPHLTPVPTPTITPYIPSYRQWLDLWLK